MIEGRRAVACGRTRLESRIAIPIDNPSFLSGFGAFETIWVVAGRPILWAEHRARLCTTAGALGIEWPTAIDRLPAQIEELVKTNLKGKEGALRLTLTPERMGPTGPIGHFWLATLREIPARTLAKRRGIRGATVRAGASRPLPGLKTTSYVTPYLPFPAGRNEWILVDGKGRILEGGSSNIFLETGEREITTPPVASGILPGIVREWTLGACRRAGIRVREKTLRPGDVLAARGAWLTASLTGFAPWLSLDGRPCPGLGPLGRELKARYRREVL